MLKEKLAFILDKLPWHSYIRAILAGETIDYFERYLYTVRLLTTIKRRAKKELRLLEVGAGPYSPIRNYFRDAILLDIAPSPGIDVVANATHLPFRDKAIVSLVSTASRSFAIDASSTS
jgi:hypothetical protein